MHKEIDYDELKLRHFLMMMESKAMLEEPLSEHDVDVMKYHIKKLKKKLKKNK